MPCNFFKNHSSFFSSFDFFLEFIIFWFFSIIGGSLFFGVIRDFIDAPTIIFLIYLMLYPPIKLTFSFYNYYTLSKKYYSASGEFTAKNLKDWYNLNPKRFIFCIDNFGFHYKVVGNTQYIDENKILEKESLIIGYKYLVPKTFKDYLYYIVFTETLFFNVKRNNKKIEKIRNQKQSNDDLLTVLNVVQSDILRVMEDSQGIINKEVEKLEELSK